MKVIDILRATSGKISDESILDEKISEIKIDSREVCSGDVFVAIKGNKFDGHDFIDEALRNGALLVICSKHMNSKMSFIEVTDTTQALGMIAGYIIRKYKPTTIAITGSTGKTTTRNLIYHLFSHKYKCLTNEKNYNNKIGVPLTAFKLRKDVDFLILELGMNHLGEISYLSKMIKPNCAVITNIGSSHIGFLKSKENILKAKLEILDGMKDNLLFINGSDLLLKNLKGINIISSGEGPNDLQAYNVCGNLFSSSFNIRLKGNEYLIEVNLPYHLISDVLLSINVALYYGIDINEIIERLKTYKTFDKRMSILKDINNNTIINDCYNSSFESLTGVLKLLDDDSKKILILGSIKELGEYSKKIHASLKPYLDKIKNKKLILVGKEMRDIGVDALFFNNYSEVIDYLSDFDVRDTLILIKGSRSLKLENIYNYFISKKAH